MTLQLDHVSIQTKANIYFDGKCISHTVFYPDGTRKSVGVIFPSQLIFTTEAPEIMELVEGKCRVKLIDQQTHTEYQGGQHFNVPGHTSFEIETLETLHYICHFG